MGVKRRRGRMSSQGRRKDRVLNARISEELDAELRDQAGRLGLSVSTIVRNVLLNTFDLVDGIVSDSTRIARALARPGPDRGEPASAPEAPRATVLAWQPGTLNVNGVCDHCNAVLLKGSRAGIAVPAHERPVFLCLDCLRRLEAHAETPPTESRT
jgi:hypothetical protein